MSYRSDRAKHIVTDIPLLEKLFEELDKTNNDLHEHRIRNEAMINSLGEGFIAMDIYGDITTVNRYACESLGYTRDELMGNWFMNVFRAVDQYQQPLDLLSRPVIRSLTSGRAISEHMFYLRKDGTAMPVSVTVSPIIMNDQPVGAIEVFRDLTQEQQLDLAKEEFVSLASHQLRTPATGVMTILSMLAAGDFGPLNAQQQTYVQKAITTNNRQIRIIEDLLNAARVDAGRMELRAEHCDLSEVVREAAADHQATLKAKDQTITLKLPEKCPLWFDAQKIRMVLDNLISNASKYSHPGDSIEVSLSQAGRFVVIDIRDHGVGMSQSDIIQLFTKFKRLENELSASVGGSGLGLFLAKGIVALHHGDISVKSTPSHGSTFTIRLPINQEAQ